ncbi:MAG TPA: MFS transporter [Burkholderiaceae bacterium]|nr:MFS transporter [Burkholderiaceae bacterium]
MPLLALSITLVIQALTSLAVLTAPILAPAASPDIGLPATQVGTFVALVYGASMVASLSSGDFVARYGALRVSQACLLLCAAGMLLASHGAPVSLVVGALLTGMGYGPITPSSSHILVRRTPAQLMGLVFSLKQTGVPLGGALAGIFLPLFVVWWGWQGATWAVAMACLLCALAIQPYRRHFDEDRNRRSPIRPSSVLNPLKAVMASPAIRRLAFCTSFFSVMQLCLTTYLVTYLTTVHHLSLTTAGLIMFAVQAAGVAGRLLWGAAADRWGSSIGVLTVLALAMGLCSMLVAIMSVSWPIWLVTVVCVAFGATAIGWNGVYLAEVARLAPEGQAGFMTGGTLFFTYLGVVLGPPIFGTIVEVTGSFAVGYGLLAAVITTVAAVLAYSSRHVAQG